MPSRLRIHTLFLSLLFCTGQASAIWEYETFKSGSLQHLVAVSGTQKNGRELEVFCSSEDSRPTLALYLPNQRYRIREQVEVKVRVDQERTWTLVASRHAMAITSSYIPKELITDFASGNNVQVVFPLSEKKTGSETFPLNRSAKALAGIVSSCK
ncbi:hypothetical protein [Parendozoicomonas sp. Alg238-R29]|uniref:hypothetical protein n=1 Tax=Parendozoicomonas sp. Alg238-R29 TaxID=2993446 RepID=UPI00248F4578|nr:hypothetical protein [Parendozoicomonas sp. Alg238-R29]